MRRYLITAFIFISFMTLFFSSCASSADIDDNPLKYTPSSEIELITPSFISSENQTAEVRDIFVARVYESIIVPYTEELSFSVKAEAYNYYAELGEKVKKGQILLQAVSKETDRKRREKESLSAEYAKIQKDYNSSLTEEMTLLKREYADSLYNLEKEYYEEKINEINKYLERTVIYAPFDGVITEMFLTDKGGASAGASLISLSDEKTMLVKTEAIKSSYLKSCKEIYGFCNDKKYEVIQRNDISSGSGSYFQIIDAEDLHLGDYFTIVVMEDYAENVVSVDNTFLVNDDFGTYILVHGKNGNEKRYVQTGVTDGVFTQIISGLAEGEKIADTQAYEFALSTCKAEIKDIASTYNKRGYLVYPKVHTVTNPIQNGRVSFVEFKVDNYSHVEVGDVICTVLVEGDELSLMRLKLSLQRLEERNGDEADIEKLRAQVEALEKDYATTEIRSTYSGTVTGLESIRKGDEISNNSPLLHIAEEEGCYIGVNASDKVFYYGQKVSVSYPAGKSVNKEIVGVVADMGPQTLSTYLRPDYSLIKIDIKEALNIMTGQKDYYNRQNLFVFGLNPGPQKALCIPRAAVTVQNGVNTVKVQKADGKVYKKSFVASGKDNDYYYVAFGVKEGETICLK